MFWGVSSYFCSYSSGKDLGTLAAAETSVGKQAHRHHFFRTFCPFSKNYHEFGDNSRHI